MVSLLKHAFPSDEVGGSLNEDVDELSLTLSESVSVGDVPSATDGGGVNTTATTGLETKSSADVLEVFAT